MNRYFSYGRLGGILKRVLPVVLSLPLLSSCFTGIESTPKISYKDVRRQNIGVSEEHEFGRIFKAEPFSRWTPGRRFKVAGHDATMIYMAPAGKTAVLSNGDTLVYRGAREVPAITGGKTAELVFVKSGSLADTLLYRPGAGIDVLSSRGNLPLPFLVDIDMVEMARENLTGKTFYTRGDRWVSPSGADIKGRKFLKVKVTDVDAADENYPFLVSFESQEKDGQKGAMLMSVTVDEDTPSLRGFENLFLLEDPRPDYPDITDECWELIRQGRVMTGMTTQEASLSLGSPREIDRGHDRSMVYERWHYPGGVYLIFEDGLLTRYHQ